MLEFEIRRGRPKSYAIAIGLLILVICLVVAVALRACSPSALNSEAPHGTLEPEGTVYGVPLPPLIPVLHLSVQSEALEKDWISALAAHMEGQAEVTVEFGRVDVLTDRYAIEVDRLANWKEGVGQAIQYREATAKVGCLALIVTSNDLNPDTQKLLLHVESICLKNQLKLLVLTR